jgi:putative transposase
MPNYRRSYVPGGIYFFTVKTLENRPTLVEEPYRSALRHAINNVRGMMPFQSIAWVLLSDHLHTMWQLPENDTNYSLRWSLIKQEVTRRCGRLSGMPVTESRRKRGEGTIWQRRFWEHTIRNDTDLRNHIDYIHFNPVKHGYVRRPSDWPYSTFHQFVRNQIYPEDWAWTDEDPSSNYGE